MNRWSFKFWIVWLVFVSALFDLLTTKNLFVYESNPIILLGGGFWTMVLVKVVVLIIISVQFWKLDNQKGGIQFLLCTGIVLMIALQTFAGINNLIVLDQVQGTQIPDSLSVAQKINQVEVYMKLALILFYYPMLVSYLSFFVYEKSRRRKEA